MSVQSGVLHPVCPDEFSMGGRVVDQSKPAPFVLKLLNTFTNLTDPEIGPAPMLSKGATNYFNHVRKCEDPWTVWGRTAKQWFVEATARRIQVNFRRAPQSAYPNSRAKNTKGDLPTTSWGRRTSASQIQSRRTSCSRQAKHFRHPIVEADCDTYFQDQRKKIE